MRRRQSPSPRSALLRGLIAVLLVACNVVLGNGTASILDAPASDGGPECVPRTECEPDTCGPRGDGCGGTLDCLCAAGSTCNGSQCVCIAAACGASACNQTANGCGGTKDCGECASANFVCGEGNSCECVARTCEDRCGWQPDGCGGLGVLECDKVCPTGETCGGAVLDYCGVSDGGACAPRTCDNGAAERRCGLLAPGCGENSLIFCGDCDLPQTCGGSGIENECGCKSKTCEQLGAQCGTVANGGCNEPVECGDECPASTTCGGGGIPNVCGCTPKTCQELSKTCGSWPDGCGGTVTCGTCPAGQACGAEGACVNGCTPQVECAGQCGTITNGCGGTLTCAGCVAPAVCNELTHQCACVPSPSTCSGVCGVVKDARCNQNVDCGACALGACNENNRCVCPGRPDPCPSPSTGQLTCCALGDLCTAQGCCHGSPTFCGPEVN